MIYRALKSSPSSAASVRGSNDSMKAGMPKQTEANHGFAAEAVDPGGDLESLTNGNDAMRRRAAPIGMSVIFSTGSSDLTGLGGSLFISPSLSRVHCGIRQPLA